MAASNYQVRRATVDDLAVLRQLWQQAQFPVAVLEPRWREFQVVETVAGDVLGAVGLQTEDHQGKLHHEAFKAPELVPQLRQRLWDRIASLAHLDGLHRLWIAQGSAMFYLEQGFEPADAVTLAHLPKAFAEDAPSAWLTARLRDPAPATRALEQELAIYRVYQQQQEQKVMRQAQILRVFAAILTVALLALIACAGYYIWHHMKLHPAR
jgi:N-acetylglutamate synthase-like GNAT family acetyltransferase